MKGVSDAEKTINCFDDGFNYFSGFAANAQENPKEKFILSMPPLPINHFLASINADGTNKERLTPAFNNLSFPIYNEKAAG